MNGLHTTHVRVIIQATFHFPRTASQFFQYSTYLNTSLAARGALAHRQQRRTTCNAAPPAKSKMAARGPKMADGVWEGVYP